MHLQVGRGGGTVRCATAPSWLLAVMLGVLVAAMAIGAVRIRLAMLAALLLLASAMFYTRRRDSRTLQLVRAAGIAAMCVLGTQ